MKKTAFIISIFLYLTSYAQQPRIISDCTILYAVSNPDKSGQDTIATSVVYIRGKDIRIDFTNTAFSQTTFFNDNTGSATILKTIGKSKYLTTYTAEEWKKKNEMYKDVTVSITGNVKKILGYDCKEALLNLQNGKTYVVYFSPLLIPSVRENPFLFKDIPGMILEYQLVNSQNEKILFTANQIDFNPVPSLKFEIPTKGYRILH